MYHLILITPVHKLFTFPKINFFLNNLIIPSIIPENINVETKVYPKNGNAKV